jgi:ABC-type uncharacterized transport system substrate-binding protein
MASRILTGTAVKDIPVAAPQQLDILINATVAESLGIIIPDDLRQKAAEIY